VKFCSHCGSSDLNTKIPPGDTTPRRVCASCGAIFYENPKIVAGCILEWQDKILLCKRAIEPRIGLWTVPAGFMENGESVIEAAAREAWEEAGARSGDLSLHTIYNLKHVDQVYILYRGSLDGGRFKPGHETLEAGLCGEADIPWDAIAFTVVREALELYFADRSRRRFTLHEGDIDRDGGEQLRIVRY